MKEEKAFKISDKVIIFKIACKHFLDHLTCFRRTEKETGNNNRNYFIYLGKFRKFMQFMFNVTPIMSL